MNTRHPREIESNIMSEATRAYIYRIALAVFGLASGYGLISPDEVPGWIVVVGAVLGIGTSVLATVNTSTK
jgi:hypothetical protein